MSQKNKTRYCDYYHNCDREEDCFNGEYCPMFKSNPDCATLKEIEPPDLEEAMDRIWEGQND